MMASVHIKERRSRAARRQLNEQFAKPDDDRKSISAPKACLPALPSLLYLSLVFQCFFLPLSRPLWIALTQTYTPADADV